MTPEAERLASEMQKYGVTTMNRWATGGAAMIRHQAAEIERLQDIAADAMSNLNDLADMKNAEIRGKDILLRQALEALIESHDDVAICLANAEQYAGYERYDKRIAFYKEQLAKHDAAIAAIKQHLGEV